jgi:prepilin-type processing-associated H-X9-DG protein
MDEPTLDETPPTDRPGKPGASEPDVAEMATIRPDFTEAATVPPRARATEERDFEPPVRDLTVSFVVAKGRGATMSYLAPEGVSRVRASFAPGVLLQGRYELDRELGRGGMGVVYLGRDVRLNRPVAIKAILSETSGGVDEGQRQAFAEEARLGANLTHPAIATVYDYGFHDGSPFAVFEFIPGMTLRDVLYRRGKLPLDEVRLIVGSLAQALDFAHDRHVVHRDLKPENIRATEQGQFKVLDLGLAKDFHSHADWTFCGTPAYASPEQASAQPCDGRTDQYALALIAFEMLAGVKPFESRDWITLLDKHVNEPAPHARTLQPDVPDSVDLALDKALSKDPNRRFASCTEFATAMGCQLLSAPAREAEVLLETTSKTMRGRWKSFKSPFSLSFRHPLVHLTLSPDAVWATYRGMLMRWPIGSITEAKRRGKWLQFRLNVIKGKKIQKFKLRRRKECQAWLERIDGLMKEAKPASEGNELPSPIVEALGEPKNDPIVLLNAKPSTRFQLLGPVDVKAAKRRLAKPALAIRGIMMGADAIVDLQEERLPGAYKTEYRASGTAVRAVDREGRLELKARWFDVQAKNLRLGLITLASLGFIGNLIVVSGLLATVQNPLLVPISAWLSLAGTTWLFVLTVGFGVLRWPQLARSVAFCFLGTAVRWIISPLASAIGALSSGSLMVGAGGVGLAIFSALFSFSVFSFYFYVGRRALAIDRDYRQIVADDEAEVDPTRRFVGRGALVLSVVYAIWLIGNTGWQNYTSFRGISKTVDAVTAPARAAAQRMSCTNNLKEIAFGSYKYHSTFARFPGNVVDKEGKPLLSWRVAILPYTPQGLTLYNKFKLDEPWDSPTNKALLTEMPKIYACESHPSPEPGLTFYQGWQGPGAFFDPARPTTMASIKDGTSNTIMVAEAKNAVPWTKPDDMPFDPNSIEPMLGAASVHTGGFDAANPDGSVPTGGFNAAFADGSVKFIKSTMKPETLKAMITTKGGEIIPPGQF